MRLLALTLCLVLAACSSSVSESVPQQDAPPPAAAAILNGLGTAAADSHFDQPIEVTDPIRDPISLSPWLVCLRSGQSEESRRRTYSAFFTDKYVSSRYSAIVDGCAGQAYHALKLS
jgi:hypothetical protein